MKPTSVSLYHACYVPVQGKTPSIQVALELCHILSESGTNLRQPVSLETQLLADQRLDSDVSKSMLQLLQVFTAVFQRLVLFTVFPFSSFFSYCILLLLTVFSPGFSLLLFCPLFCLPVWHFCSPAFFSYKNGSVRPAPKACSQSSLLIAFVESSLWKLPKQPGSLQRKVAFTPFFILACPSNPVPPPLPFLQLDSM